LPAFSKYDDAVLPREVLQRLPVSDSVRMASPEGAVVVRWQELTAAQGVYHRRLGRRDFALLYDEQLQQVFAVSAIDVYGYTKMSNLRKVILVCLACSVLLLAFVSWYWTRKMLAPIAAKIEKARQIGTNSLNLRLEVKNPSDELGMLAQTFNDVLDRLERGFRAQQQFIGNASHELRTPLTILRTEAEWALHRPRTAAEYEQVLTKVLDKSRYLAELVNRLLILARIDGPANAEGMQAFRLDEMLMQAVEQAQGELGHGIIACELDAGIHTACQVKGDAGMIQTAIANLLDNAVKYGEGKPIRVQLRQLDGAYCVAVTDQGIGISPADLQHIFEPFYRSAAARRMATGTGLGLPLIKAIAGWHGGKVWVDAQPGHTSFYLQLPAFG
jgi:heavy metal sensor kinase